MSMKNSNDTIGNRTRDLPACGAVPPTNCATACPTKCAPCLPKFTSVHQISYSPSLNSDYIFLVIRFCPQYEKKWNIKTSLQITFHCSERFYLSITAEGVMQLAFCCRNIERWEESGQGMSRDLWIMAATCFVCAITICWRAGEMCGISLASLLLLRYDPWVQTCIAPLMFIQNVKRKVWIGIRR